MILASHAVIAAVAIVAFIILLIVLVMLFQYGGLWIRAMVAGAPVPLLAIVACRLRGSPPGKVMDAYLTAAIGGVRVPFDRMEAVRLAGGDMHRVATMLVALKEAGMLEDPEVIVSAELQGRLEAYHRAWQEAASRQEPPPPPSEIG